MNNRSRSLVSKVLEPGSGLRVAQLACALFLALPCAVVAEWTPSECTHVQVLDSSDTDQVAGDSTGR
jgi:hypothetical protein